MTYCKGDYRGPVIRTMVLLGALLLCHGIVFAHERQPVIDIAQPYERISLVDFALFRIDQQRNLGIEGAIRDYRLYQQDQSSVSWQPFSQWVPKAFIQPASWFVFHIRNSGNEIVTTIIETRTMAAGKIETHILSGDSVETQYFYGNMHPFADRPIAHRFFLVPLEISPGQQKTVFMKLHNSAGRSMSTSSLRPMAYYLQSLAIRDLLDGIFIGLLLLFMFASIGLRFWYHDNAYLYYAASLLSINVAHLTDTGLLAPMLPRSMAGFGGYAMPLSLISLVSFLLLFSNSYIDLDRKRPMLARVNQAFAVLGIPVVILCLYLVYHQSLVAGLVFFSAGMMLFVVNLINALFMWFSGNRQAKNFFIAWLAFSVVAGGEALFSIAGMAYHEQQTRTTIISSIVVSLILFYGLARKLYSERLAERSEVLETKAKAEFMAKMSHEIRTPINGILGMTDILGDTKLNEEQSGYVSTIDKSGKALLTVVNDVLDYTRLEAGRLELHSVQFNLAELVDECGCIVYGQIRDKELGFRFNIDPEMPDYWIGDDARIRQILLNLLGNAVKFTSAGSITVSISPLVSSSGLRVAVEDTGIGIRSEDSELLFRSFKQADSSTSRIYGGSGLGLSISKELVEMMGGQIGVESELGLGSTFWVALPLAVAESQLDKTKELVRNALAAKKILWLDDDRSYLARVEEQLKRYALEPVYFSSLAEGQRQFQLREESYDIIILGLDSNNLHDTSLLEKILNAADASSTIVLMPPPMERMDSTIREGLGKQLKVVPKPLVLNRIATLIAQVVAGRSARKRSSPAAHPGLGRRLRILVAEDNDVNYQVLNAMLAKGQHFNERAHCGAEAVSLYLSNNVEPGGNPYDLILMDVEMPRMDGLEASRQIRALEKDRGVSPVKLVGLTAHTVEEKMALFLEAGMDNVITKPVSRRMLQNVLGNYAKKPASLNRPKS